MQLTVRDVSKCLSVSEAVIYRWIKRNEIPAQSVHNQYRFNRAELLEWAIERRIRFSPELLKDVHEDAVALPNLSEALEQGGILRGLDGSNKEEVLRSLVQNLRLPDGFDKEFLLSLLIARESLGSTAVGDGIAIPHTRHPIVVQMSGAAVTLCYLDRAVEFGAIDGRPVSILFTLISSSIRTHLHLLSRIAFALRNPEFKALVLEQGTTQAILDHLRRVEGPGTAA